MRAAQPLAPKRREVQRVDTIDRKKKDVDVLLPLLLCFIVGAHTLATFGHFFGHRRGPFNFFCDGGELHSRLRFFALLSTPTLTLTLFRTFFRHRLAARVLSILLVLGKCHDVLRGVMGVRAVEDPLRSEETKGKTVLLCVCDVVLSFCRES